MHYVCKTALLTGLWASQLSLVIPETTKKRETLSLKSTHKSPMVLELKVRVSKLHTMLHRGAKSDCEIISPTKSHSSGTSRNTLHVVSRSPMQRRCQQNLPLRYSLWTTSITGA